MIRLTIWRWLKAFGVSYPAFICSLCSILIQVESLSHTKWPMQDHLVFWATLEHLYAYICYSCGTTFRYLVINSLLPCDQKHVLHYSCWPKTWLCVYMLLCIPESLSIKCIITLKRLVKLGTCWAHKQSTSIKGASLFFPESSALSRAGQNKCSSSKHGWFQFIFIKWFQFIHCKYINSTYWIF